jgi:hypothetical protein
VAFTNNHMYFTSNVYDTSSPANFLQSVVVRIPIDTFVSNNVTYQYYNITDHGSLRLARGCADEMFFASHQGQNPVRMYRWGDGTNATMNWFDVNASAWNGAGPYSSPGPGGVEWLTRTDARITGACRIANTVGFVWSVNADANHPQPYVKALVVNIDDNTVAGQPDLWNPDQAFAYPSVCPGPDNRLGISVFFGGGNASHPSHVVGFRQDDQWVLARTATSTHCPSDPKWGDYVSCELYDPVGNETLQSTEWTASGYTFQGGRSLTDIEARFVRFGVGA